MLESKPLTFLWIHWNCLKWGETSIVVFRHHVPLHIIFSTKGFFTNGTEPTQVNFSGARKGYNQVEIDHLCQSLISPKISYALPLHAASVPELNTEQQFLCRCHKRSFIVGLPSHAHGIWSTSFRLFVTWFTEHTYVRVYRLYGWGRGDYQKEGRGVSGVSWQVHIFYIRHSQLTAVKTG